MQKIDVVLVLLNLTNFKAALRSLDFVNANLVAIVAENGDAFDIGAKKIPRVSFASMQELLDRGADYVWLLNGYANGIGDLWRMKKFLLASGVPDDNIVNFEIRPHISSEWLGNLRYVEKFGADFFATGISYAEVGLDLNYIPHVRGRGVNLAGSNQDLLQGYMTARHVFAHVKPGTIKFVLIGLTPYSFRYENAKAFAVCSRNLQYMLAVNAPELNLHDRLLKLLVSDNVRNLFAEFTAEHADLNFDYTKSVTNKQLPAKALVNWEAELKNLTKKFYPDSVEKNFRVLENYIRLCLENGAKPIGVVFPFAPIIRDNYDAQLLNNFRALIRQFEEAYDFTCVDLFDLRLGYECFYNTAHLNRRGAAVASTYLGLQLYQKNILPTENFCAMSYTYFDVLSDVLTKDSYNEVLNDVFELTAAKLRRKSKLKVGFVLYDSSMWCGDELYNLFATDERFETTIFLCRRMDIEDELVRKDFWRGVEQFKSRGLNVVAMPEIDSPAPAQDVLIFLTPYQETLPEVFRLDKLTAETLPVYVPYAINISKWGNYFEMSIMHTAWKLFMETKSTLRRLDEKCKVGAPRGYFSGYPRADAFFDGKPHRFDWKMTRPDAKKIIWAPHWSIAVSVNYATFQWNYKFMYEFAKAHPEISWVVKPHPNLLFSAVDTKVFPDDAAFEEYLAAWDALPNAKVVTGGYYQDLFATSDGMIHDSGSFIAEYQFTHKPMIFLTREGEQFNELGEAILNVSYLVDGRDLQGIAALMQKVFVEGNDPLFARRKAFFDEQLNYVRQNGCTAGEFIYRTIADELKGVYE